MRGELMATTQIIPVVPSATAGTVAVAREPCVLSPQRPAAIDDKHLTGNRPGRIRRRRLHGVESSRKPLTRFQAKSEAMERGHNGECLSPFITTDLKSEPAFTASPYRNVMTVQL